VEAFSDREGNPTRPDILQALNRMSSMLYILMIRRKKET
jgi:ethanolamine utilization cobalamin adenosyltransferase